MAASRRPRSRQPELFARSKRSVIEIAPTHRLVMITEETDWTALEELVQELRRRKLKNDAGRPPHLRALIGAVMFRALRKMTYRDTEDQIRHYAPARYLCGLTETDWSPDANTIQDFEQLLGEDGVKKLNEHVVKWAVEEKLADPTVAAADTTAQEAAVPYPNEMRLMATFVSAIAAASKNVGAALHGFVKRAGGLFQAAKTKLREFRLFAKKKSKAVRNRLVTAVASIVNKVQAGLAVGLEQGARHKHRLTKFRKAAWRRIQQLHLTMRTLLPQLRYWLRTGFVAKNKIVSLYIPQLYAILRGKVGKPIEFGLNCGIERLRGGFLLATLAKDKLELMDSRFAVRAAKDHQALFGKAPRSYAYDRAGSSEENVAALKKLGVSHVGLAPRGKAKWQVSGRVKKRLISSEHRSKVGLGRSSQANMDSTDPPRPWECLQTYVLANPTLDRMLGRVRAEIEAQVPQRHDDIAALEAELANMRGEQKRLAIAVALSDDVPELVAELQQRTGRIQNLEAQLAAAKRTPAELATIEGNFRTNVTSLREALAEQADLREVFLTMFPRGLTFEPARTPTVLVRSGGSVVKRTSPASPGAG